MGEAEYRIFIVLATIILLVFIFGIIIFIFQYHKRKLAYEREKVLINEQHVKELLNTKLEIQKQTMQYAGREIHDNIGQQLMFVSVKAKQLAHAQKFPEINPLLNEISNSIDLSLDNLRTLSHALTNIETDVTALQELLEGECAKVKKMKLYTATCYFNTTDFKISGINKIFLLRIVQEFIQNSIKHAKCKNIRLDFNYSELGLTGVITDDGIGFDLNDSMRKSKEGIGLLNMKKRAELIGAKFSLSSIINEGTTLHIFIPENKINASQP